MNQTHWCEDKSTLVDYLYGELDADGRRVFEGHLRTCVACALEVERLQAVRSELAEWMPPAMDLGFTVVPTKAAATVLQPSRWALSTMPTWARAAAAVFLIGAGIGFANLQVRSDANGLSISTGWMTPAPAATASAGGFGATGSGSESNTASNAAAWQPQLAALEADLRREIQAMRADSTSASPASATASRGGADDQAVLRRVHALIAESERRQEQELARRLTQFGREAEMQRRADLVRLEQGFGRVEAQRGAQAVRQQQMLDYLYRVSTSRVP